ncbi:hypothetical protein DFJ73DRAFT_860393 [Zopfochytrium polystomum]|nr:hypothetical protein DFJ73DRAFT_860393 [Zopfochytrium polystomum]
MVVAVPRGSDDPAFKDGEGYSYLDRGWRQVGMAPRAKFQRRCRGAVAVHVSVLPQRRRHQRVRRVFANRPRRCCRRIVSGDRVGQRVGVSINVLQRRRLRLSGAARRPPPKKAKSVLFLLFFFTLGLGVTRRRGQRDGVQIWQSVVGKHANEGILNVDGDTEFLSASEDGPFEVHPAVWARPVNALILIWGPRHAPPREAGANG